MIAGPGHGGSRYRVKTKKDAKGRHDGYVQHRWLCFWLNVDGGFVTGNTPVETLRSAAPIIEAHRTLRTDRDRKVVTYL